MHRTWKFLRDAGKMAGQGHLLNMATMDLWALPVAFNLYNSPKGVGITRHFIVKKIEAQSSKTT